MARAEPAALTAISRTRPSARTIGGISRRDRIEAAARRLPAPAMFCGTIAGQALLLSNDGSSWGTINTGTMAINGNGFASAANGSTSSNGHVGSTFGNFFGPNADEIGGSFDLDTGSTGVKGSFGAVR